MSSTCVNDERLIKLFPLRSIADVVQFFGTHLEIASEPDLALLSIVIGIIENTLTSKCGTLPTGIAIRDGATSPTANNNVKTAINKASTTKQTNNSINNANNNNNNASPTPSNDGGVNGDTITIGTLNTFPVVELETVQYLYEKFRTVLSIVDDGTYGAAFFDACKRAKIGLLVPSTATTASDSVRKPTYATRDIIKRVSDVIWNSLNRSTYKDRAHLQSLYSYLTLNKLDCFGVALAVVAGCQRLGYADVHLAISEDHAWVIFGETGEETIEVTWHGKGIYNKDIKIMYI